jgi:hypothetical protein
MTEYVPTPEDDELEATIGRLFDQLEDAREDSAVRRWVRSMASSTCSIIGLAARLIFLRRDAEWSEHQRDRGDRGQ